MLVSLYTNFLAGVLICLYTLAALWHKQQFPWKKWLVTHATITLVALPLIPLFLQQYITADTGIEPELIRKGVPVLLAKLGVFFYAVPIMVLLLLAVALVLYKKKITGMISKQNLPEFSFVLLTAVFGIVYVYFSSHPLFFFSFNVSRFPITHSFFLIRHSYFLVPIAYLYLAHKISTFKVKRWAVVGMAIFLVVNTVALAEYYQQPTKAQWKEAVQFVKEKTPKTETPTILLDRGGLGASFLLQYYYQKPVYLVRLTWTEGRRDNQKMEEERLLQVLSEKDDFWLILSGNYQSDEYYRKVLDRNYQRDISHEFYLIKVYHYTQE